MKKTASVVACLLAIFLLLNLALIDNNNLYAKEILIRLATPAPPGDFPLTVGAEDLAERFNKRVKDRYKIEVFAGGSLVKIPETLDAVRIGAIEMAMIDWGIFSFLDPKLALVGLPFLINSLDAGIAAEEQFLPLHDALLKEKFNQTGLGMYSVGGIELIAKKPITKLEDWKGLLLGAGSPITAAMFKELGASPVTIPWTDLYESLQKNIIDATAQVTHGALMTGLFDVCTDLNIIFGQCAFNGMSINLKVWNKMPADVQMILQEEINHTVDWMNVTFVKLQKDDMHALKKKGVKIHVVSNAERNKWAKAVESFNEKQITSHGVFGQRIKEIADEANQRYPYQQIVID